MKLLLQVENTRSCYDIFFFMWRYFPDLHAEREPGREHAMCETHSFFIF
jgi:hypothetical protein